MVMLYWFILKISTSDNVCVSFFHLTLKGLRYFYRESNLTSLNSEFSSPLLPEVKIKYTHAWYLILSLIFFYVHNYKPNCIISAVYLFADIMST